MHYTTLAPRATVEKVIEALKPNNFTGLIVKSGAEALEKIKELVPKGVSVMNGASTTLQQIGYVDYLKAGEHGWNNIHEAILNEKDEKKQAELRKHSVASDYYLGSAHAVTEDGRLVFASNTGSQLPHLAFTSPNLILVVSTKKIVPNLEEAMSRIQNDIIPLEDERMKKVYGVGTQWSKTLILNKENPIMGRTIQVIFVEEDLGF
ncbi:MAG: lactate utilization protein [Patescibacteria group bacterium]